jgi:hypothetical protein
MTDRKSNKGQVGLFIVTGMCCLALVATFCCLAEIPVFAQQAPAVSGPTNNPATVAPTHAQGIPNPATLTQEERIELIEKTLRSLKPTIERTEERSYFTKMLGGELLKYLRLMVIALIVIAIAFPVTIWMLSRRRILGLSGLSTEVAATLLVVEERQAKLANILKEIQGEIDYLHTMSVPDLKNLIQQAESYLKQNEQDLEKTGTRKSKS